nr:MAG TPA: ryanodine receptor [Bacteriophage sp.]
MGQNQIRTYIHSNYYHMRFFCNFYLLCIQISI